MIIYLWDAPPRCGVSGSLEKAQEAAGTTLIAGHAPSARVESARLVFSAALEPAYARTGRVWQARSAKDGVITWEPGDTGLGPSRRTCVCRKFIRAGEIRERALR